MTCLEAQSNIMAFIDHKLSDEQVTDFVRHMKYCKNCAEELEIYYTLIVGMRQLDHNEELSHNFKADLELELDTAANKIRKAKRFRLSTFGICFAIAVAFLFVSYNRILVKVHNVEQVMLKESQGEHYFYDYFGEDISICEDDLVVMHSTVKTPKEPTFYEKIHEYNVLHANEEEGEDENE